MPPDDSTVTAESAVACAREAYRLHCELRDVFDALEAHLAAGRWADAAALLARRVAIEAALRPLAATRAAATPEETASWASVDAIARELDTRQTAALRLARATRDATAVQLAHLHESRTNAARYHDETRPMPVFASRRA
jgi:hypothetical protein